MPVKLGLSNLKIYDYLTNVLSSNSDTAKYASYYKIYLINEDADGDSSLYGRARDICSEEVIVLAPGLDDTTCAHELFHALGLYHSFSELNQHTFEKYKTDNIMDYSDVGTEKIPVIATWQFQWNILHENLPTVAQWKIMKRKEEKKKRKINK